MIDFGASDVRIFLHLLGAAVWIGGQIVLGALVPVLRGVDPEAPRLAARRFAQVAWPFFVLVVVTGIWNVLEVDPANTTLGYQATLGIKLLLVALSGVAAFVHSSTESRAVRGITGGGALVAGLGAFVCGVLMVG